VSRDLNDRTALEREVRAWIADDPDPVTREELERLLADQDWSSLSERFSGFLEFGTAGLRGPLGAGPSRMNRAVVARTALGLIAYLKERGGTSVVIGYDARYNSDVFASDTAELVAGAGLQAHLFPRPLPTPVLAYAVEYLGCSAGVMVTASHNPPQDNGYKVYLGGKFDGVEYRGSQIVPPADGQIAAEIAAITTISDKPRSQEVNRVDEEVVDRYLSRAVATVDPSGPRDLITVYTAMHGVGWQTIHDVLTGAGFSAPIPVPEQQHPDPDFPTVAFPNPEEPGAIDMALSLARDVDADLVIANDPDADRCAVAVNDPRSSWRMLRGDEVGVLLGDHLARQISSASEPAHRMLAASIVSSSMLGEIAESYGLPFRQTLTGFKWLAKVDDLAFGYEEALGYCVDPDGVNDKDGISAAVVIAELAAELKSQGLSLIDRLDELATRHGHYATDQLSLRLSDLSVISPLLRRVIQNPPAEIAGFAVEGLTDLSLGSSALPPTEGVLISLAERGRIIIRPSGTEPKLKCYFEVVVGVDGSIESARTTARERLLALKTSTQSLLGL
jgi:phosphomannomutase